ncbi:hypothetical protein CMI37_17755 [Candidatus Pacearchaeota archaeon]|nr:hypothetical protein [Candidatus Pacearchaeota archaeon]
MSSRTSPPAHLTGVLGVAVLLRAVGERPVGQAIVSGVSFEGVMAKGAEGRLVGVRRSLGKGKGLAGGRVFWGFWGLAVWGLTLLLPYSRRGPAFGRQRLSLRIGGVGGVVRAGLLRVVSRGPLLDQGDQGLRGVSLGGAHVDARHSDSLLSSFVVDGLLLGFSPQEVWDRQGLHVLPVLLQLSPESSSWVSDGRPELQGDERGIISGLEAAPLHEVLEVLGGDPDPLTPHEGVGQLHSILGRKGGQDHGPPEGRNLLLEEVALLSEERKGSPHLMPKGRRTAMDRGQTRKGKWDVLGHVGPLDEPLPGRPVSSDLPAGGKVSQALEVSGDHALVLGVFQEVQDCSGVGGVGAGSRVGDEPVPHKPVLKLGQVFLLTAGHRLLSLFSCVIRVLDT